MHRRSLFLSSFPSPPCNESKLPNYRKHQAGEHQAIALRLKAILILEIRETIQQRADQGIATAPKPDSRLARAGGEAIRAVDWLK